MNKDAHKGFIEDTDKILDRLATLFSGDSPSIPKVYREVHSLKGAAGFAGLKNIEDTAHRIEQVLLSIRDGLISLDQRVEKTFFEFQDYCLKSINSWKSTGEELDNSELIEDIKDLVPSHEPISIEVVSEDNKGESFFSGFELDLLTEAMHRGEKFYKVHCQIDTDEEMKYPRLFLIINNLEKISNVVKISPSLEEINKNRSKEITLYLTTSKPRKDIYSGLSLDRIKEVELIRVDYHSFINQDAGESSSVNSTLYGSHIEIERTKVEEILNYAQDLQNKLLFEEYVIPQKKSAVEDLLKDLRGSLRSLTEISTEKAFSYLSDYVASLSKTLGKSAQFKLSGGEILINREKADTLKDILLQLIKNSLDHGIETPVERRESGKDETGTIMLKFSKLENMISISLSDDGRGIDTSTLIKRAVDNDFIGEMDEVSLLSIISQPGFSTSKDVNKFSGRGVGLDIVISKIINDLDGKVKLDNSYGKGMVFHLLIPITSSTKKFTLFKYRDRSYGISQSNSVQKLKINKEAIEYGDNRALNYRINGNLLPIFTPFGRYSSSSITASGFALVIRYLGKKALLLVDEFILEKEFFSSTLTYENSKVPGHKVVLAKGRQEDFLLIEPSIINL